MASVVTEIVDSYGALSEVRGQPVAGIGLVALTLRFEHASVLVEADADDDTIRLTSTSGTEGESLSHLAPWTSAVGRGVRWVWSLTNQQGYDDGVQMEFGNRAQEGQPIHLCVQLLVVASALRISEVSDWV